MQGGTTLQNSMRESVLVTGASKGIGAAMVRHLVAHGNRVVGVARDEQALRMLSLEKIGGGGTFEFVAGSVTDPEVMQRAVNLATNGSTLIGVILNAATSDPIRKICEMPMDEMRAAFDLNLTCNFRIIQMVLPHLRESGGTIVLMTSGIVDFPAPAMSVYCSTKAGLNMLAACLAKEEPDVTVLAVSPGFVDTDMVGNLMGNWEHLGADQRDFLGATERLEPNVPASAICRMVRDRSHKAFSGQAISYNT